MQNSMILNGKKYRLIPIENEWQITCIYPTNKPKAYCGHNGCNLPKKHSIHKIVLGDKEFTVGDRLVEGEIEEFIYKHNYVMAKIKNSSLLIDID